MPKPNQPDIAWPQSAEIGLCEVGRDLLRIFAEARQADFLFLVPADLKPGNDSAFVGIPEWDRLAEHRMDCEKCHV